MKLTVFGSGTSNGVPMIGCDCAVCTSSDPRNKRNRPCLLVGTHSGHQLLIDTPPELRLMATTFGLRRLDAVLYTHSHADHLFGLDDLRAYNFLQHKPVPLYAENTVAEDIRRSFRYCFVTTQTGGGKPQLQIHSIAPGQGVTLGGLDILPLRVYHGELPVLAFLFGNRAAYVTDVSRIPDDTREQIMDLDVLLLDAVRRAPHSTHFHLDRAIEVVRELNPKRAYFVHLSHDYDYLQTNRDLAEGIELAYDGLEIEVETTPDPV